MIAVVVAVGFGLLALGVTIDYLRLRHREQADAQRLAGGWVLRRARATEHFCKPPGSDGVENGIWHGIPARNAHTDVWTIGDVWVCGDCGRAWTVSATDIYVVWIRSEKDDLP